MQEKVEQIVTCIGMKLQVWGYRLVNLGLRVHNVVLRSKIERLREEDDNDTTS